MGRSVPLLVVIILLLLANPAQAGIADLGGTIHVEWQPDPLTLRSGKTGTIVMKVRNDADHKVNVSLWFLTIKSVGASGGNITPDFFELMPGAVQEARVRIRSYASFGQSEDLSDGHVQVRWGRNLTRGDYINQTWDGQEEIVLDVRDDLSVSKALSVLSAFIVLVPAASVAVYLFRRRRQRPVVTIDEPMDKRAAP